MEARKIKVQSLDNYNEYFNGLLEPSSLNYNPFPYHHTDRYLLQCFCNLQEKYDRGQKDFTEEQYLKLENFMKGKRLI